MCVFSLKFLSQNYNTLKGKLTVMKKQCLVNGVSSPSPHGSSGGSAGNDQPEITGGSQPACEWKTHREPGRRSSLTKKTFFMSISLIFA